MREKKCAYMNGLNAKSKMQSHASLRGIHIHETGKTRTSSTMWWHITGFEMHVVLVFSVPSRNYTKAEEETEDKQMRQLCEMLVLW